METALLTIYFTLALLLIIGICLYKRKQKPAETFMELLLAVLWPLTFSIRIYLYLKKKDQHDI